MIDTVTAEGLSGFAALGLDSRLVAALGVLGYEEPTPIQREAIPALLSGSDLVGQAATGTGKTAAFTLPLLQRLHEMSETRTGSGPGALILVPTRELAMQVGEAVRRYGRALKISVTAIFGGAAFGPQLRALKQVDVVVATPGRALDHIRRGTLSLKSLVSVVLDEADEMLDMGFAEDIEAILLGTPAERQTMLFSATMPPRIAAIAQQHLQHPIRIRIAAASVPQGEAPRVRQAAYLAPRSYRLATLTRVLELERPSSALIFCRTRTDVDELAGALTARGYRAAALHGGMTQEQRTRVMQQLRDGSLNLLAATDVAARGLDIDRLSHVINYDVPSAAESYVHRIGRVGRAGREGVAITLASPRDERALREFEKATRQKIDRPAIPTAADLQSRRLQRTQDAVLESLQTGDLEPYRAALDALSQQHDLASIALAALKLAHQASGADRPVDEIPEYATRPPRDARQNPSQRDNRPAPNRYEERPRHEDRPQGGDSAPPWAKKNARKGAAPRGANMVRLFIGVGSEAGVRPQDLVGAIAGEAGISGREIGAIRIQERFSLVDVAEDLAQEVITALRAAKVKGRKVPVRRDFQQAH